MVDIQEPQRRQMSDTEKLKQAEYFLMLLHRFLIFYLSLHNLIIPVILNSYKNHPLLSDIHYWFFYQFILYYALHVRKCESLSAKLVFVGLIGTIARVAIETVISRQYGGVSWGIFSIYLSEVSCFIFYFYYFAKKGISPIKKEGSFLTITLVIAITALQFLFSQIEVRGALNNKETFTWSIESTKDWTQYGCKGSIANFKLAAKNTLPIVEQISIQKCGFEKLVHSISSQGVELSNDSKKTIYMSLYSMKKHGDGYKWVAKHLFILKAQEKIKIDAHYFLDHPISVLKSNQQQELGIQVLLNHAIADRSHFGNYQVTPSTIKFKALL